jgi:acetyltransferase-like isoleucine patch superfamily enzyme
VNPSRIVTLFLKATIVLAPWSLKRQLLQHFFGFNLDPTARIGFSWIYPKSLRMAPGSRIGAFTVAVNLDILDLGEHATISRNNWITGFPTGTSSPHFAHQPSRSASFYLGPHASITKGHHIDATNRITIGAFTTIAGYRSQILSHAIDLQYSRQHSKEIIIGEYCFVGSNCVILGGSLLPDYCVLGALSLLNKPLTDSWFVYAGQPAIKRKPIDQASAYFRRKLGSVV